MESTVTSILNKLIKISKDGEQGFNNAAENVENSSLQTLFREKAAGCRHAVQELQKHVAQQGETPADSGSVMGAIHRGWMSVKSAVSEAVTGHDDHAVLAECERGEDVAKAAYSEALKHDLPADIRTLIQHQSEGVRKNHDEIRDLRDAYALKKSH